MKKFILPAFIISLPYLLSCFVGTQYYEMMYTIPALQIGIGLGQLLLPFFLLMYFVRKYKTEFSGGIITFRNAFRYTFKLTLLWSLFTSIITLVYYLLNGDLMQKIAAISLANSKEKIISTAGAISASEQKMLESISATQNNPYFMTLSAIIMILFFGTLFSLIIAAIVKSKPAD